MLTIYRLETNTEENLGFKTRAPTSTRFAFLSLGSRIAQWRNVCYLHTFQTRPNETGFERINLSIRSATTEPFVRWWRGSIKLDWWNYTFGINLCRGEEDWCSWRTRWWDYIRYWSSNENDFFFGFLLNYIFFLRISLTIWFSFNFITTAATQFDWKWLQWSFSFFCGQLKYFVAVFTRPVNSNNSSK